MGPTTVLSYLLLCSLLILFVAMMICLNTKTKNSKGANAVLQSSLASGRRQCTPLDNKSCQGGDITNAPGPNAAACCNGCNELPGCNAYTYDQYNRQGQKQGTCYYKSSCDSTATNYNAASGVLDGGAGVKEDEEFLPPFEFVNQCPYGITVRGVKTLGSSNCELNGGANCFPVLKGTTVIELLPEVVGNGKTIFFSTKFYTDQGQPSRTSCRGQSFCSALEIYDDKSKGRPSNRRRIFNFDNQYSYGIPIGVQFNDNDGPIQDCPESNLDLCTANPSWCYSTKGQSDNCYHNATETCPDTAWKVKSHPDDPVVWCNTNDQTLGVVSFLQDNPLGDGAGSCRSAPPDWVSVARPPVSSREPLCKSNNDLYISALQLPGLVLVEGDYPYTPLTSANADMIKTKRPGGAKKYQAAVNAGCGQFATQKIAGAYPYTVSYGDNGRHVVADNKRKDHASTFEGDQTYTYSWDKSGGDKKPMMAGNVAIQCTEQDFDKVTVTFCPIAPC